MMRPITPCDDCGRSYPPRQRGGNPQVYCSERCKAKHDNRLRRQRYPERVKAWWDAHPNYGRELSAQKRRIIFEAYGGAKCDCCGESIFEFLTVDHTNGGGNKHRKTIRGNFYGWLIKNGFPFGFRVLCMNCNFATRYGRPCPHKRSNLT